jgi:hypothetical protein
MLNINCTNNYGSLVVEYADAHCIDAGSKFEVELRYVLHADLLFSERLHCRIGWLTALAKRNLIGDEIKISDRKGRTYWSVEYIGKPVNSCEIVNLILGKLFADRELPDMEGLDCFDNVCSSEPEFLEPKFDFVLRFAKQNRWNSWPSSPGRYSRTVYVGMLLNAPIALDDDGDEYHAFPSATTVDDFVDGNRELSLEVFSTLSDIYADYLNEVNTYKP